MADAGPAADAIAEEPTEQVSEEKIEAIAAAVGAKRKRVQFEALQKRRNWGSNWLYLKTTIFWKDSTQVYTRDVTATVKGEPDYHIHIHQKDGQLITATYDNEKERDDDWSSLQRQLEPWRFEHEEEEE